MVHIEVGNGVVVFVEAFAHKFLVIYITGLHIKEIVEVFVGVDSVANPIYILDIVLLAFVYIDIYIDFAVVVGHYAVGNDARVAVAFFVIFVEDSVEVVLIV